MLPPVSSFAAGFTDATSNWGLAGGVCATQFVQIKAIAVQTTYRIVNPLRRADKQDYGQHANCLVEFFFTVKRFLAACHAHLPSSTKSLPDPSRGFGIASRVTSRMQRSDGLRTQLPVSRPNSGCGRLPALAGSSAYWTKVDAVLVRNPVCEWRVLRVRTGFLVRTEGCSNTARPFRWAFY